MINTLTQSIPIYSWQGKIACQYVDKTLRLETSQIKTSINTHVYCLVLQGQVNIQFAKHEVKASVSDFLIFPPHIPPLVLSSTDDYRAICLIVSSGFILDCPTARYAAHITTYSLLHEEQPYISLKPEESENVHTILKMFIDRICHPGHYTAEALQSLYGLLLSDMMTIMEDSYINLYENQSSFKLFVEFNKLLVNDFCEHHEVSYYANRLGISPRYLSLIVKQISHITVAAFINQHLMLEACWLLRTSDKSIFEISKRLHFADQASFSKFFKRQNGRSPLQYRREESS